MAHQPVGSGASIALTTDTANTTSSGIGSTIRYFESCSRRG